MKKIFAIALAVVMVFAVSATAFAAIGFPAVAAPGSGISVDVVGLEATTGFFQTNAATYLKYDQTKGVIAGTDVTYMVTLTLARSASNDWIRGEELYIWTDNINPNAGVAAAWGFCTGANGAVQPLPAAATANSWDATDLDATGWVLDGTMGLTANDADMWVDFAANADVSSGVRAQTLYVLVRGTKVAETKDATISASIYDVSTRLSNTASVSQITITKNGVDYEVTRYMPALFGAGNVVGYDVMILEGRYAGVSVCMEGIAADTFNRNYQCTSVYVDSRFAAVGTTFPNPAVYIVGINNLIIDFARIGAPSVFLGAANPNYAGLKGALDEVLGIFGFTFDELKLLNNAGFQAFAGSARTQEASWTYYAYTTALTVTGPTTVPDTGDMSVAGIALIALAAILGTALVIKKVRA